MNQQENPNNEKPDEQPDELKILENEEEIVYEIPTYRFVQVLTYDLSIIIGFSMINVFAALDNSLKSGFGASDFDIYYLKSIFYIVEIFLNIPVLYVIQKLGNRDSMILGCVLLVIGSGLRLFIRISIIYALVGQTIVSFGFQLFQPIIGAVSADWFPPKERIFSITSADCAFGIAGILSFYIPTQVISENDYSNTDGVFSLMLIDFVKAVILLVVIRIFFRNKPTNPLNFSSLVPREGFKSSIVKLAKNKDYRNLFIALSILLGCSFSYRSNLVTFFGPFGFSQYEIGIAGTINVFSGFFSRILISIVVWKYPKIVKLLFIQIFGLLVSYSMNLVSLYSYSKIFSFIISGFLGFFIDIVFPPSQELSIRLGFPIDENFCVGAIFTGGSVMTSLYNSIFSLLLNLDQSYWTPLGFSIILFSTLICSYFYYNVEELNNREKYETRKPANELKFFLS